MNRASYSPKENWPFINYLETGSITDNRVSKLKRLVPGEDRVPSRARRKISTSDIVYSTVRPNQKHYGWLKDVPKNLLASTGFAVISGRDGVSDSGFLYWFLIQDHIVKYLQSIAEDSTSAYPSIRPSDIELLPVSLPPFEDQRAISYVLEVLDDKIELNRRMCQTLEEMAQALFKSWFVDFDPVRAKMEGRWRPGESLPGLPAHLYDLFPDRLVDSELGPIPIGWRISTLGEVAEELRRNTSADDIGDSPYISLAQMPRKSITLFEWTTANEVVSSKLGFKKWEFLFGKLRPYFHKVGVAPIDGVCSTDIVVVRPRLPSWFGFVLGHLSSAEFVHYTNAGSTGTRMPRTSWKVMANYELVVPQEELVRRYNKLSRPLIDKIVESTHGSRCVIDLRDTLLPRLVSGELRIPVVEYVTS